MGRISAQSRPRRAPGIEVGTFGADTVVLDAEGRVLRGLNATAARILELADGTRTAEGIAAALAAETGALQERVTAEVSAFLEQLVTLGLVLP